MVFSFLRFFYWSFLSKLLVNVCCLCLSATFRKFNVSILKKWGIWFLFLQMTPSSISVRSVWKEMTPWWNFLVYFQSAISNFISYRRLRDLPQRKIWKIYELINTKAILVGWYIKKKYRKPVFKSKSVVWFLYT